MPAKRRAVLAIGLAALGASVFLPPLFAELSLRGQRSIIVTVAVVVLWTTAVLDSGTTALLAIALLALTGDAVLYYPAQSASSLVIYERGHVSAADVFRFGIWMTLVAYAAILFVALPYWTLIGRGFAAR